MIGLKIFLPLNEVVYALYRFDDVTRGGIERGRNARPLASRCFLRFPRRFASEDLNVH